MTEVQDSAVRNCNTGQDREGTEVQDRTVRDCNTGQDS